MASVSRVFRSGSALRIPRTNDLDGDGYPDEPFHDGDGECPAGTRCGSDGSYLREPESCGTHGALIQYNDARVQEEVLHAEPAQFIDELCRRCACAGIDAGSAFDDTECTGSGDGDGPICQRLTEVCTLVDSFGGNFDHDSTGHGVRDAITVGMRFGVVSAAIVGLADD